MAAAALLRSMERKLARAPPPPPPPLLARMAATAGLRSGAALPSLATKIARTPSQPKHRHILNRRLHSGSTTPPTTDKDKIIADLRRHLWDSRASAGISGFLLTGAAIHAYFWLLPEVEKERERLRAMKKLKPEEEHPSASLAQIIARTGYRKTLFGHTQGDNSWPQGGTRAAMDRITKLDPSQQKEGCGRVG